MRSLLTDRGNLIICGGDWAVKNTGHQASKDGMLKNGCLIAMTDSSTLNLALQNRYGLLIMPLA